MFSRMTLRVTRQQDTEKGAVVFAAGPDLSIMGRHDLVANGKSEPGPRALGRVERF